MGEERIKIESYNMNEGNHSQPHPFHFTLHHLTLTPLTYRHEDESNRLHTEHSGGQVRGHGEEAEAGV